MKPQGASKKTGVRDTKNVCPPHILNYLNGNKFDVRFSLSTGIVYYPMINYYTCVVGVIALIGMAPIGSYF